MIQQIDTFADIIQEFDIDEFQETLEAWKRDGQEKLEALKKVLIEKIKEKIRIEEEIEELYKKEEEMEKFLGIKKEPAAPKNKKIIIRPILKQILIEGSGNFWDFDGIVELVQKEKPEATEKQIRISLETWAQKDSRVIRKEDDFGYYTYGWKE